MSCRRGEKGRQLGPNDPEEAQHIWRGRRGGNPQSPQCLGAPLACVGGGPGPGEPFDFCKPSSPYLRRNRGITYELHSFIFKLVTAQRSQQQKNSVNIDQAGSLIREVGETSKVADRELHLQSVVITACPIIKHTPRNLMTIAFRTRRARDHTYVR